MSSVSPLEEIGEPLFYSIDADVIDLPPRELDSVQRVDVRTLRGMQKEAVVANSQSGNAWRLASDEGDYLDGDDIAPCPLSFFTTGMVSGVTNRILGLADERGIVIDDIVIVLDSFYTMQGSALRGDMTGGALDPEFTATIESDADYASVTALVEDAVATTPVMGLVTNVQTSLFNLSHNGEPLEPERVSNIDAPLVDDPASIFDELPRGESQNDPVVRHTGRKTEDFSGDRDRYTAGEGSSLQAEQNRILHIRGTCTIRDDGIKRIEQRLFSPKGSIFRALSDEPPERGGAGRAPDALSYVAAGIGFCFMTQFGRYADIVGKQLDAYRIVQDTHFGDDAEATPVKTHVFLESPEDAAFARDILDMSEQTCFLHALCRTELTPKITVESS